MALKVIIRRRVPKQKEQEVLPLLIQLRALATAQPGYISGETLRNVNQPDQLLVISTWQSMDAWEAWESSKQRLKIQETIDALLGEKTDYGVYFYG